MQSSTYTMGAIPSTTPQSTYTMQSSIHPMPSNSYPGPSNHSTRPTSDHTTLPRMWDAYASFKVIARDSNRMRCIGSNTSEYNFGKHCGWWWSEQKLPENNQHPEKYQQLRSLLNDLETKHPREAEAKLEEIASLSLCHHHQKQAKNFKEPWRVMLRNAAQEYAGWPSLSERDGWLNIEEWKAEFEQIRSQLAAVKSDHEDRLVEIQKFQAYKEAIEEETGKLNQRLTAKEVELKSRGDQIEKLIDNSNHLRSQLEEERKVSQRLGSDLENAKLSNAVLSDEVKRHVKNIITKNRSSAALKEEVARLKTYNTILEDLRKALKEDLIEREELARVSKSLKSESEKDGVLPTEQKAVTAEQNLSLIEKSLQEFRLDHAGSHSKLEEAMKAAVKKQEEMSVQITALKQAYEVDLARLNTDNKTLTVQNNVLQAKLDFEKEELTKLREEMSISNDNLQDVKETATKTIFGQVQSSAKAAFEWMWMATWKRRITTTTQ